jgi:hypothetical protein
VIVTGGSGLTEARDRREQSDQREESGDDLARLTSGLGARAASRRPTPTLRAATTGLGSAKTVIPADGKIGNGIVVIEEIVGTVETAVIADAVTLMTDLDAVTCSTSDPDVAAARIVPTAETVETKESGREVLHPRGARSLHQT